MTGAAAESLPPVSRNQTKEFPWHETAQHAPVMVATMARYLDQLAVSARPSTVTATSDALRFFAGQATRDDPELCSVAGIARRHIEAHKQWMATRPGRQGKQLSPNTIAQRLGFLRTFFERTIEWGYHDAPDHQLVFPGDFPERDEPLPKFLDDPTAAKFMAALAADPNQRRRLIVELLARTGMRAGELGSLEANPMVTVGDTHWLRIPIGKLHNDRYVPLHPILVELITQWLQIRPTPRSGRLVERNDGQPFDRRTIHRYVEAVAKRAGVGHVHPHQLRHTLATQAINRGMSLEAIAALLGHRSMRMTLTYARISDRTVADEYFRVTQAVEDNYHHTNPLPTDSTGPNMRRLADDHRRLLGNGHCNRPATLACQFETICERCGFYETGPQFVEILRRQHHNAEQHADTDRANIYTRLLHDIDNTT
ncbi:MAG: tyrosine-type recombinase/integrase [Acidimicrobiales bacterium]